MQAQAGAFPLPRRVIFSIPRQLHALSFEPFEGRQHSGIDVRLNSAIDAYTLLMLILICIAAWCRRMRGMFVGC